MNLIWSPQYTLPPINMNVVLLNIENFDKLDNPNEFNVDTSL